MRMAAMRIVFISGFFIPPPYPEGSGRVAGGDEHICLIVGDRKLMIHVGEEEHKDQCERPGEQVAGEQAGDVDE